MSESSHKLLNDFLLEDTSEEEICFAVWYPAQGKSRYSALIHEIILPNNGERIRHGTVSAMPEYVDRVKEMAREKHGGVAMIHTHPHGVGPQGVSITDLNSEQNILSREIFGVTGLPLVGMTLSGDSMWSARIYPQPFKIQWCTAVRIVGKNLAIHYNTRIKSLPKPNQRHIRTTSIWGDKKQSHLMSSSVGIIGVGSVGAAVGEILARLGVGKILVMDYDTIKIHNLDRIVNATYHDIGNKKINVVKKALKKSTTHEDFSCLISSESVVEEKGYLEALDCDVLFSCVDRPWPRQVLNHLAYSCLIPVIDGGVRFKVQGEKLIDGMYRSQTVGPERVCMNCLGAYDASEVQADRDGLFDDPEYIQNQEEKNGPSRQNIMPFVFGLAALETTQFVELVTNLGNKGNLGQQPYDYYTGEILPVYKNCVIGCEYVKKIAFGNNEKPFLGIDKSKQREIIHKKGLKADES